MLSRPIYFSSESILTADAVTTRELLRQVCQSFAKVGVILPATNTTGLLTEASRWLDLRFPDLPLERLVLPPSNFSLLALGGALLISSNQTFCQQWEDAGGEAIFFESPEDTRQKLVSLVITLAKAQRKDQLQLSDLYSRCLRFAAQAHAQQFLPGTSLPYLTHLVQVVQEVMLTSFHEPIPLSLAIPVALLHDVLEDTSVTMKQLQDFAGMSVALAVEALTKNSALPPDQQMSDSLIRIRAAGPVAALVKLADRLVNLQAPPQTWSVDKIAAYQQESQGILETLGWASPRLSVRLQARLEQYPPQYNAPTPSPGGAL